jgi:hypothetical protein
VERRAPDKLVSELRSEIQCTWKQAVQTIIDGPKTSNPQPSLTIVHRQGIQIRTKLHLHSYLRGHTALQEMTCCLVMGLRLKKLHVSGFITLLKAVSFCCLWSGTGDGEAWDGWRWKCGFLLKEVRFHFWKGDGGEHSPGTPDPLTSRSVQTIYIVCPWDNGE